MKKDPLPSAEVIAWITAERFAKLGDTREAMLARACDSAPNVPTAGIWTLQLACIMPSEEDLKRWSADVAKLQEPTVKSKKGKP